MIIIIGYPSYRVYGVPFPATDARRAELLLEPWVCPRQKLLKGVLEESESLRPLAVRLTNLSYW